MWDCAHTIRANRWGCLQQTEVYLPESRDTDEACGVQLTGLQYSEFGRAGQVSAIGKRAPESALPLKITAPQSPRRLA